jgi:hypothetical protein
MQLIEDDLESIILATNCKRSYRAFVLIAKVPSTFHKTDQKLKKSLNIYMETVLSHGLATEEGRRTSFPPLRYGCQLQPENQNKHG